MDLISILVRNGNIDKKRWIKEEKYLSSFLLSDSNYYRKFNLETRKLLSIIRLGISPLLNKILFTEGDVRVHESSFNIFLQDPNYSIEFVDSVPFKDLMEKIFGYFFDLFKLIDGVFKKSPITSEEVTLYRTISFYSDELADINLLNIGDKLKFNNYMKVFFSHKNAITFYDGVCDEGTILEIIVPPGIRSIILPMIDGVDPNSGASDDVLMMLLPRGITLKLVNVYKKNMFLSYDKREEMSPRVTRMIYTMVIDSVGSDDVKYIDGSEIGKRVVLCTKKFDNLFIFRDPEVALPVENSFFEKAVGVLDREKNVEYQRYLESWGKSYSKLSDDMKRFIVNHQNYRDDFIFRNFWTEKPEVSFDDLEPYLSLGDVVLEDSDFYSISKLMQRYESQCDDVRKFMNDELSDAPVVAEGLIGFRPIYVEEDGLKYLKAGDEVVFRNYLSVFSSSLTARDSSDMLDRVRLMRLHLPNKVRAILVPHPLTKNHTKEEGLYEMILERGLKFRVRDVVTFDTIPSIYVNDSDGYPQDHERKYAMSILDFVSKEDDVDVPETQLCIPPEIIERIVET